MSLVQEKYLCMGNTDCEVPKNFSLSPKFIVICSVQSVHSQFKQFTFSSTSSHSFHSVQKDHIQFKLVSIELKIIKEGVCISCA